MDEDVQQIAGYELSGWVKSTDVSITLYERGSWWHVAN